MKEPRILVVCTGNICRSAFAEVALRRHLASKSLMAKAASAGTVAVPGNRCPEEAVQAAAAFGIDLAPHRAQRLTARLLDGLTHLIAMEEQHLEAVDSLLDGRVPVPWALNWDVPDPYGLALSEYESCFQNLCGLCADFAVELRDEI